MTVEVTRPVLIGLSTCLNGAALWVMYRDRDRRERATGRRPARLRAGRLGIGLLTISGALLLVAGVLLLV